MGDQCRLCDCRGNIDKCFNTECGHHEGWMVVTIKAQLSTATARIAKLEGEREYWREQQKDKNYWMGVAEQAKGAFEEQHEELLKAEAELEARTKQRDTEKRRADQGWAQLGDANRKVDELVTDRDRLAAKLKGVGLLEQIYRSLGEEAAELGLTHGYELSLVRKIEVADELRAILADQEGE